MMSSPNVTKPSIDCNISKYKGNSRNEKVEGFPDSGSNVSIISTRLAKKLNLKKDPTEEILYNGSGNEIPVCGQTWLYIQIKGGERVKYRALILVNITEEFVLGKEELILLKIIPSNYPNVMKNKQTKEMEKMKDKIVTLEKQVAQMERGKMETRETSWNTEADKMIKKNY